MESGSDYSLPGSNNVGVICVINKPFEMEDVVDLVSRGCRSDPA